MQKNGAENEKTAALAATDGGNDRSLTGFKELKGFAYREASPSPSRRGDVE